MRRYSKAFWVAFTAAAFVLVAASLLIYRSRLAPAQPFSPQQTTGSSATMHLPMAPAVPQSVPAGLWRVDHDFMTTLHIKNMMTMNPIQVTPVLYMADGTEYDLAPVHLAPTAVADISVNQALAQAPDSLASHYSAFGSAALKYTYQVSGVVTGHLMMLDVPRSLVFTNGFATMGMMGGDMRSLQTLEGIWWKHDPGVGGFLSLTNTTGAAVTVGVQVLGAHGLALPKQSVTLAPHATQMLDLASLAAALPGLENQEGGVRIQYQGMMGDVIPVGGLENDSEGYSADMPIWPHNPALSTGKKSGSPSQGTQSAGMATSSPVAWTLGAVGIMTGYPDPAMGFPGGTHFTPYVTLRNTTSKPLVLTPALYLANSGQSKTFSLPKEVLAPYETRQVDMAKRLKDLKLVDFSGNVNLTYSFMGQSGDLIMAPGSVDQTGNYVFQVLAQSVNPGWARDVPAWTTANGYDTMFTLWNPSNAAEDLMATFYFANGSGQYQLPIHLDARASMNLDMAQLVALNERDAKGHTFPAGTSGGSVEFSSPQGMTTTISLSVGAAEFNVENATCSSCCICCGGICEILVCPNPGYCPYQVPEPMYAEVYFSNGGSADITNEANWSTGNGTIATVNNTHGYKGIVTGHAAGSTTLSAQFTSTMAALYCICNGYCYTTSSGTGSGQAIVPELAGFNITVTSTPVSGQTNSVISGQSAQIQVQAKDVSGGVYTGYTGTVRFSSNDSSATLPANYTFTASDSGSHTFSVTLKTVSGTSATRDLTVTDTATAIRSTQNIDVWFSIKMDIEFWKTCGFQACTYGSNNCPNGPAGAYYCKTAYLTCNPGQPSGYSQQTAFLALTYSDKTNLYNKTVSVVYGTQKVVTFVGDAGPTLGNNYWNTGTMPSLGGCLSDLLASDLGYTSYGCNGSTPYGGPVSVFWRFGS